MRTRRVVLLLAVWLLIGSSPGVAADAAPTIGYPSASDFLVIELSLAAPLTPAGGGVFTRIYGDGRVHVHRPSYYRESGDFEAWLTLPSLDSLLRHLATERILDFDSRAIKQQRLAAERRRLEQQGAVPGVADAPTTTLTIHLERYAPAGAAQPANDYWNTISWYALEQDAEWYPELESIVRLHSSVTLLRQLSHDVVAAARSGDVTVALPPLRSQ